MTETACVTCGATAGGYYVCRECTRRLCAALSDVAPLVALLTDSIARRTATGDNVGVTSHSAERALPVDLAAAETARDLHSVLTTWARDLAEHNGAALPADDTAAVAAWLTEHTTEIRIHPAADELTDEIHDACHRAWKAVDRPAVRHFAGPCDDCGTDLYGRGEAASLRCAECGAVYDTAERRAWLLDQARDQLVTAAEAARALPALLGHGVTPAMIRGYAHRGRLATRPGVGGQPRYRVGDLVDVLA